MANVRLDTSGVDDGHYIFNLSNVLSSRP
jgi:hypothetical protein